MKFNGRKKRQYFSNGKSEFNGTKKFGINTKNYIGQRQQINNSKQVRNAEVKQGNETTQRNKSMEPEHGQKEHYIHREDNRKHKKSDKWLDVKAQTKDKAYNSRKFKIETQREDESQVKQGQDEFLGKNSLFSLLYYYLFH